MADNVIIASFGSRREFICSPRYQYDKGQKLKFEGIELPLSYEVDFSNGDKGSSITQVGNADGVDIPDQFFTSGDKIVALLYLVSGTSGRTVYKAVIPLRKRPMRTNVQPTPSQKSALDEAIDALNDAVTLTEGYRDEASDFAANAEESAQDAEAWAVGQRNGQDVPSTDPAYQNNSKYYAGQASNSASDAYSYSVNALDAKNDAVSAKQEAERQAGLAEEYADNASGEANRAEREADRAENAVAHNPTIIDGTWWTYDPDTQAYIDTHQEAQGEDGFSPLIQVTTITGGHRISITDAEGTTTVDVMDGDKGDKGNTGNGISSIAKTGTSGKVDTYTITYTNGNTATFTVTNGSDGFSPVVTVSAITGGHEVSIQDATQTQTFDVMDGEVTQAQLDDVEDRLDDISDPLIKYYSGTETGPKIINNTGLITDVTPTTYKIITYAVSAGETVWITAAANWGNAFWCFYNDLDAVVQLGDLSVSQSAFSTVTEEEVPVPSGATKLVIAYNTTSVTGKVKGTDGYTLKKQWKGKKWVCVGDSLTAVNVRTTVHYFDYVANDTGITTVNMGVSNSGYAREAGNNNAFYQRISSCPSDADVVTIFGSFNDLGAGLSLGSVDDTGTTTIAGCINTTIDNLQTVIPLVNLGIVAPTPWGTTQPSTSGQAYDYVEMLKAICARRSIPFLDLWRCSNLRPWDADFLPLAYSKDNGGSTHPDENGHKLIAPRFKAFLETLLL